jgi:hypothetical protein
MDQAVQDTLKQLRSLKADQFSEIKQLAVSDVRTANGEEPTLELFQSKVSFRRMMEPNDWIGVVLFVILLLLSASHMITLASKIAKNALDATALASANLVLNAWGWVHQIGFFGAFSELGVIFFYVWHYMSYLRWAQENPEAAAQRGWRARWVSYKSGIALLCTFVSVYANVTSLINNADTTASAIVSAFIGCLIPIMTLFLGERFAEILMKFLYAKRDAEQAYYVALTQWQESNRSPETHPDFRKSLARRIVEYYRSHVAAMTIQITGTAPLKAADITRELARALAAREIAAEKDFSDLDDLIGFFGTQAAETQAASLLSLPGTNSNDLPASSETPLSLPAEAPADPSLWNASLNPSNGSHP